MFIEISSVAGSEAECLRIIFLAFIAETNSDMKSYCQPARPLPLPGGVITFSIDIRRLLVTQLDSTPRPLSDDQLSTALATQIGPHPLQKDTESQAALRQELNVDESPHQPRHKAAELNAGAL